MFTAFDLILVISAVGFLLGGFSRRWFFLDPEKKAIRNWPRLLSYLAFEKKFRKRPWVGIAHLCLVWGFIIFSIAVILAQFNFTVGQGPAHIISFILDAAGLMMVIATLFLLFRRISIARRQRDDQMPRRTLFPMIVLLVILLSGFLAEGARLILTETAWLPAAPVGWVVSSLTPASPLFMQLMIRLHFFAVLLFIATIPFTFMRHAASASINVLLKSDTATGALNRISLDREPFGLDTVKNLTNEQFRDAEACVSCGRCDEHCPALISGKPLSPRSIMTAIQNQIEAITHQTKKSAPLNLVDAITAEEIWSCTTCMACVDNCPVLINPMDKIVSIRRHWVMGRGQLPNEARSMIRNLELFGDVNGRGAAYRTEWKLNQNVSQVTDTNSYVEVLLWIGCGGAFHPSYQKTVRAMVKILKTGGVNFGILGKSELCCGDPARRLGDEALFVDLTKRNIQQFEEHGVTQIITLCPHCFNTLKNEYPALGFQAKVWHAAEYVAQMLREKKIFLTYPYDETMAVHDPCYLGRYNGIYEPLREICSAVPSVVLEDLPRSKAQSFCCGGGGGRMWLHETVGENINHLRAEQIVDSNVSVVGTACPYCLTMLEDGVNSLELENPPKVVDVIEIVAASLKITTATVDTM